MDREVRWIMKRLYEKFGLIFIICIMLSTGLRANFLGEPTATFYTTRTSERLGYNVHRAGDVNGDGIDDFMIGTFHYNVGGWDRGAVNLFLGKTERFSGSIHIDAADGRLIGHAALDAISYDLGCGDFNGDGYSDILVGAPAGSNDAPTNPGYAYILFGKQNPDWSLTMDIRTKADVRFDGETALSLTGYSVSSVGDMNNDGCDEFIVTSLLYDSQGINDRGCVYFFKGKPSGWTTPISLSNADAIFIGTYKSAQLGSWASDAGDVNGDGIPDFMFGCRGNGNVYLVYGRAAMDWGKSFLATSADVTFIPTSGSSLSNMLDRGGDVNNDGYDDLILSDVNYSSGKGIVYVMMGRQSFSSPFSVENASGSYLGLNAGDNAGFWVAGGFDYNYDGYTDFLFGTHGYDGSAMENNGAAYMVLGKASGWAKNVSLMTIPNYATNTKSGAQFGECVAVLGDINGDGVEEVAISAPYWGTTSTQYTNGWGLGRVYVYYNDPPVLSPVIEGTCTYANTGFPIENVKVNITGSATTNRITNAAGEYQYTGLQSASYHFAPSKTLGESTSGIITSYDAGLVARYCVNLGTLDSEQFTAADVNEDGKITLLDAVGIARFIVGLPPMTGFVAGRWSFTPAYRDYTNIVMDQNDQNYQGYLLGNVSGNWTGSASAKTIAELSPFEISLDTNNGIDVVTVYYSGGIPLYSADFKFDIPENCDVSVRKHASNQSLYLFSNKTDNQCLISSFSVNPIHANSALFEIVFPSQEETFELILQSLQFCLNDGDQYETYTSVGSLNTGNPTDLYLEQNYPNPFNAGTVIHYRLDSPSFVSAVIYNSIGERVLILKNGRQETGSYTLRWDGQDQKGMQAPSGVYIVRLQAGLEQKMIKLIKID